ncbi:MAG: ROK family protein [Candidatus Marinimicrobia bacterium]|nr:ROK family protein [Candidatus Neomarinimicrobiota bacterium]
MNRLGIDIGGTKIEGVILQENGSVIKRERIPTESHKGYQHILRQISKLYSNLTENTDPPSTVGICTPGAISYKTNRLKNSNTACLIGQPIKEDVEAIAGQPVAMDNDANCFTQAETSLGAAKGYDLVFGVIMGTGVGGGICFHGKVHKGHQYIAGEWGHSLLHPGGNLCYCGKHGCVETYISGPALEKRYYELTGESKPLKEIAKNPPAEWEVEFLENFGIALSNVVNILDPDIIVLGGGVSNINFLYEEGSNSVRRYCFNDTLDTPIVKNKLGDSAGVFGAAYLNL